MAELTNLRRELFSRYYLATNGNQTRAAKLAGYAPRSAHVQGHRAIMDDKVKARIEELKKAAFEEREITPELITKAMWQEYTEATHSRDRKAALDSLARIRGMFTDNVNQATTRDAEAVLTALKGHLPDNVLSDLARRFNVPLETKEPTHEPSGSVN